VPTILQTAIKQLSVLVRCSHQIDHLGVSLNPCS